MIRLFANANYDFIKWRRWAYGLTAALIVPGFALFLVHGLNYSIEFTGGTLIQVQTTTPVGTGKIRTALDAAGIRDAEIQQFGGANEYVVRARIGAGGVTAEGTTQAPSARKWGASSRARRSSPSSSRSSSRWSICGTGSSGASASRPCWRRSTTSSPPSRSSAT